MMSCAREGSLRRRTLGLTWKAFRVRTEAGAPGDRPSRRAPGTPEREDAADEGTRRLPVKTRRDRRQGFAPHAPRRRFFPISRPARCLVGGRAQGSSNAERPHRVPSLSDSHVGGNGTASIRLCQRKNESAIARGGLRVENFEKACGKAVLDDARCPDRFVVDGAEHAHNLAHRPYTSSATTTINAAVTAAPPAMIAQAAGRAKFIVHPTPNRSGRNTLASSLLK